VVATENSATLVPPPVVRISGSEPRFPMMMALLRLRDTTPPAVGGSGDDYGRLLRNGIYSPRRTRQHMVTVASDEVPTHHDGVFRRPAVVVPAPADGLESALLVDRAGGEVGLADLQVALPR